MREIFKDIPGYEGIYQVSNYGNVKSLQRTVWREITGKEPHYATIREKILTPQEDKMGYVHVRLRNDNKYVLWKVHQLVAYTFLGHDRHSENIVHHLDEDKQNNMISNLQILPRGVHSSLHHKKI